MIRDSINALKKKFKDYQIDGYEFKGTPVSTIIAGQIKMRDGKILGEPDGKPLKF